VLRSLTRKIVGIFVRFRAPSKVKNSSKTRWRMQSLGLKKEDTAIIYMPMIPQAAFAMLACARVA
jgi:hypothetical protein